jgi:hypothetical protein
MPPPLPSYQDARGLGRTLILLVPVYLLTGLASQAVLFALAPQLDPSTEGTSIATVAGLAILMMVLAIVSVATFIALAVIFGIWMARVHGNTEALTGSKLPKGMAWTVAAWYIPLVGGFLAAAPLLDLWRRGPGGPVGKPLGWAILFGVSHVLSLAGAIAGFVVGFQDAFDASMRGDPYTATGTDPVSMGFSLASYAALVASGICMCLCIQVLQRWQEGALRGARPQAPPMPIAAPRPFP